MCSEEDGKHVFTLEDLNSPIAPGSTEAARRKLDEMILNFTFLKYVTF